MPALVALSSMATGGGDGWQPGRVAWEHLLWYSPVPQHCRRCWPCFSTCPTVLHLDVDVLQTPQRSPCPHTSPHRGRPGSLQAWLPRSLSSHNLCPLLSRSTARRRRYFREHLDVEIGIWPQPFKGAEAVPCCSLG